MISNKTVIGYRSREIILEPTTDIILVILLKITICTEMITYKYGHDFTLAKPSLTIPATFPISIIGR
ncbi:hypothetical protein HMPREF0973_01957 [Prevotella veroralis F0319]|uniref:Uncharacterized protein n=1 Tax=Prevotella veroralis F0319 TaxID=649761 RepID=C9MQQ6_9BACT|nr:hypothetical protein HMPREF0973_01957 [Prevotella veroralis F0319]